MSKKARYRAVQALDGGFFAMRLHAVATFLEEDMAIEFAKMKNGGSFEGDFSVSEAVDGEFYVLRESRIALFYDEGHANEYVAMKESRVAPAVHVVSSPAPINHDAIWAEATAMVQAGK
jgi:hypothetical protein